MSTQISPSALIGPRLGEVTVGGAVEEATAALNRKGLGDPRRWAETLVSAVVGVPHRDLGARRGAALSGPQIARLQSLVSQATPEAPVAYLINQAPFLDSDFEVTPDTLICKPDTELFVEIVLDELARSPLPPAPRVLELCTGSGCVAITFAARLPGARIAATDLSPAALAVAHRNVARHGMEERVFLGQGDLFAPVGALADGRPFDLIVSNPPYIPTDRIEAMGRHVAEHEPHLALDGGADGLDPHRRILAEATEFLAPGGRLFLEHEYYHGPAARVLAKAWPAYDDIRILPDANRRDRALHVRRRA